MSKLGMYLPPLSQMALLDMEAAEVAIVPTLGMGSFTVHPAGEPWADDLASWQSFYCKQGSGIVVVSVGVMLDRSEPPRVLVHPGRSIIWRLLWPSDARLAKQVVAWLLENGATNAISRPATHC